MAEKSAEAFTPLYVDTRVRTRWCPFQQLVFESLVVSLSRRRLADGGPGRAGGGQELGGPQGLELYMQRVALQGERGLIESLAGLNRE